jgi:hypothetical protein
MTLIPQQSLQNVFGFSVSMESRISDLAVLTNSSIADLKRLSEMIFYYSSQLQIPPDRSNTYTTAKANGHDEQLNTSDLGVNFGAIIGTLNKLSGYYTKRGNMLGTSLGSKLGRTIPNNADKRRSQENPLLPPDNLVSDIPGDLKKTEIRNGGSLPSKTGNKLTSNKLRQVAGKKLRESSTSQRQKPFQFRRDDSSTLKAANLKMTGSKIDIGNIALPSVIPIPSIYLNLARHMYLQRNNASVFAISKSRTVRSYAKYANDDTDRMSALANSDIRKTTDAQTPSSINSPSAIKLEKESMLAHDDSKPVKKTDTNPLQKLLKSLPPSKGEEHDFVHPESEPLRPLVPPSQTNIGSNFKNSQFSANAAIVFAMSRFPAFLTESLTQIFPSGFTAAIKLQHKNRITIPISPILSSTHLNSLYSGMTRYQKNKSAKAATEKIGLPILSTIPKVYEKLLNSASRSREQNLTIKYQLSLKRRLVEGISAQTARHTKSTPSLSNLNFSLTYGRSSNRNHTVGNRIRASELPERSMTTTYSNMPNVEDVNRGGMPRAGVDNPLNIISKLLASISSSIEGARRIVSSGVNSVRYQPYVIDEVTNNSSQDKKLESYDNTNAATQASSLSFVQSHQQVQDVVKLSKAHVIAKASKRIPSNFDQKDNPQIVAKYSTTAHKDGDMHTDDSSRQQATSGAQPLSEAIRKNRRNVGDGYLMGMVDSTVRSYENRSTYPISLLKHVYSQYDLRGIQFAQENRGSRALATTLLQSRSLLKRPSIITDSVQKNRKNNNANSQKLQDNLIDFPIVARLGAMLSYYHFSPTDQVTVGSITSLSKRMHESTNAAIIPSLSDVQKGSKASFRNSSASISSGSREANRSPSGLAQSEQNGKNNTLRIGRDIDKVSQQTTHRMLDLSRNKISEQTNEATSLRKLRKQIEQILGEELKRYGFRL